MRTILLGKILILFFCLLLASKGISGATAIGFSTSSIITEVNQAFSLDLVIDGEGAVVGAFDVDIIYDPSQISFDGHHLTEYLGDDALGEVFDLSLGDDLGLGVIDLFAFSLLSSDELATIQSPSFFPVAKLMFSYIGEDVSTISIDSTDFFLYVGDENGDSLDINIENSVTVIRADSTPIPEPATTFMLGAGLIVIIGLKKKSTGV